MRFFFLILMLLSTLPSFAQNPKQKRIDSLEKELKQTTIDTTRVNILCLLARDYGGVDSTLTFERGFEALKISKDIGFEKGLMDAYIALGGGFMDYYAFDKAEEYLLKGTNQADKVIAKDSSENNLKLWIRGYYNLGINYGNKGDYAKQYEYTLKVVPLVEKRKDSLFMANIYTNLGIQSINLGNKQDAYNNFVQSGKLHRKVKNDQDFIFDRLNFSTTLYQMDSLTKMKSVLDEAKGLLEKNPDSPDWHLYNTNIGLYHAGMGDYDMAITSLDKAKSYLKEKNMNSHLNQLFQRYSAVYEKQGDFKSAIDNMTEYLNTSKEEEHGIGVFQGYYKRSQYQAAAKNFEEAYADLLTALTVYDSVNLLDVGRQINDLTVKYNTAEKENEILALKVTNEEKKSQTFLLVGLASILALILFIGFYAYGKKLKRAKKKEQIQQAEVQLLKQEQQNKIFSAMIEGQEKERKRLAIDLHDGLGGRLSGISLNLSKLDKDEPKQYPKKQLQKVMKDLDDSLTELRTIARNMMPETLVKFGLQAALKDYCSSMTGRDTKVTLQFYGTEKDIEISQQVTIYRVIQELINNAIKHAEASEVLVQYMREGNQVDITVEDNGVGFKKEVVESKGTEGSGMGLSNLRTRVAYLKGDLDFHSEENEGTTVNVHLTVDHDHAA